MLKQILNTFLFFLLVLLVACIPAEQITVEQQVLPEADNRYDSEFPAKTVSNKLEYLSTTVKKFDCLAFYKSYTFPPDNRLDEKEMTSEVLRKQSISTSVTNQSVSGTATVIYYDGTRIGLLTCAHIVDFPETIITRYDQGKGPIEVVSIKIKQQNYIKDLPQGGDVEIIATDDKNDIAFLGKTLEKHGGLIPVLNFPVGNTKDLDWGSVVYTLGYPVGHLMVTRAIVSNPDRAKKGRFLTDALYNRGISGSPILAIRDGAPNFELVGMASSASARQVYYVKPGKESSEYIKLETPFEGDLYVDQYKDIKYGVTFNVSIEEIVGFLNSNGTLLLDNGFEIQRFFK